MINILFLIIFILLIIISKKKGIKIFICLILNFLFIISFVYLAYLGFNSFLLTFILVLLASITSLFFLNGINLKTKSSFISIIIVTLVMFLLTYFLGNSSNIGGFTHESRELIGTYSVYINYSMNDLIISVILITSIGTIIDTSLSISTAVNEVFENNKKITNKELYLSGINIGKDILSTTINTLYFASISAFIIFIFWNYDSTFLEIINHKMFAQDFFEILICFIGSILIIPITSFFISKSLTNK